MSGRSVTRFVLRFTVVWLCRILFCIPPYIYNSELFALYDETCQLSLHCGVSMSGCSFISAQVLCTSSLHSATPCRDPSRVREGLWESHGLGRGPSHRIDSSCAEHTCGSSLRLGCPCKQVCVRAPQARYINHRWTARCLC